MPIRIYAGLVTGSEDTRCPESLNECNKRFYAACYCPNISSLHMSFHCNYISAKKRKIINGVVDCGISLSSTSG